MVIAQYSYASQLQTSPFEKPVHGQRLLGGLLEASDLRKIEVESVSKMLACGTSILGVKQYCCGSDRCPHVKHLCNTCHCRACPSSGKKATYQWIAVQKTACRTAPGDTWCPLRAANTGTFICRRRQRTGARP